MTSNFFLILILKSDVILVELKIKIDNGHIGILYKL